MSQNRNHSVWREVERRNSNKAHALVAKKINSPAEVADASASIKSDGNDCKRHKVALSTASDIHWRFISIFVIICVIAASIAWALQNPNRFETERAALFIAAVSAASILCGILATQVVAIRRRDAALPTSLEVGHVEDSHRLLHTFGAPKRSLGNVFVSLGALVEGAIAGWVIANASFGDLPLILQLLIAIVTAFIMIATIALIGRSYETAFNRNRARERVRNASNVDRVRFPIYENELNYLRAKLKAIASDDFSRPGFVQRLIPWVLLALVTAPFLAIALVRHYTAGTDATHAVTVGIYSVTALCAMFAVLGVFLQTRSQPILADEANVAVLIANRFPSVAAFHAWEHSEDQRIERMCNRWAGSLNALFQARLDGLDERHTLRRELGGLKVEAPFPETKNSQSTATTSAPIMRAERASEPDFNVSYEGA